MSFFILQAAGAHDSRPKKGMCDWYQSILRLLGVVLIMEVTSFPTGILHN